MEGVLKGNVKRSRKDIRRVVFVMPTKALVNQISADVYRRYAGQYKDCFAVWTREQQDTNRQCAPSLCLGHALPHSALTMH